MDAPSSPRRVPVPSAGAPGARGLRALCLALLVAALGGTGCAPETGAPSASERLAALDSLLVDVGGTAMERLDRAQRWRMLASVGPGLPPETFTEADLPEPGSYGAGMLKAYCDRCHWLPAPAMHSAEEWPLLIRRMQLRAATLERRLGGPLTEGAVGELLLSGISATELDMAASAAQVDSLTDYVVRNALPTIDAAELPSGQTADFYRQSCSTCHELPDPAGYTAAEWEEIVRRMPNNMRLMHVEPLTKAEQDSILGFLQARAGD